MKCLCAMLSVVLMVVGFSLPGAADTVQPDAKVQLNDAGIKALNDSNWQLAFEKFTGALDLDPKYKLAQDNLAVAHNNYGLTLKRKPAEALAEFHKAIYLNPRSAQAHVTLENINEMIRKIGKNPKSFADRVALADAARWDSDFAGAIVEYSQALLLKDDPGVHRKLAEVYQVIGQNDKAKVEYEATETPLDSASK